MVALALLPPKPPFLQMSLKGRITFGEKIPGGNLHLTAFPFFFSFLSSAVNLRLGIDGQDGAVLCWALVALAGVFLAVHLFPNPEVATHLQVEPTVGANVARRVAVTVLLDFHSLVSGEKKTEKKRSPVRTSSIYSRGRSTLPRFVDFQLSRNSQPTIHKSKFPKS